MTLKDLESKYGSSVLTFSHYYKYTFWFSVEGLYKGKPAKLLAGQTYDPDDIYRAEVSNNEKQELGPIKGRWDVLSMTQGKKTIFEWGI